MESWKVSRKKKEIFHKLLKVCYICSFPHWLFHGEVERWIMERWHFWSLWGLFNFVICKCEVLNKLLHFSACRCLTCKLRVMIIIPSHGSSKDHCKALYKQESARQTSFFYFFSLFFGYSHPATGSILSFAKALISKLTFQFKQQSKYSYPGCIFTATSNHENW